METKGTHRTLAKNISIMSIGVFLSRILGLIRDQVMAFFFGTTYLNDAFNVGYNIPNLLRRLFGEGALSTAFVPIYNDIKVKQNEEEQIKFALNLLSVLTLILCLLTILGIALAPLIVKCLYPGLAMQTKILAIKLTRIIFPYLFFIGLSSTFIAILNSHNYFFMTGLSSALLNIGMMATVLIPYFVLKVTGEELIIWAGWGVIIGGFLQTIINLPYLKKIGYRWAIYLKFGSEAIVLLWRRFIPSMIGIGIREINLIADSLMASFLPIGSITALNFGNRLMQFPLGIFGISTGTAVLPFYSRCVSTKHYDELSESIRFTGLNLAYIMLPVTTIIIAIGEDFVRILFQSGAFKEKAVWMTSQALIFYSLGLIFYSLNQTLTPVFYAYKDTKTPVKIAAVMVALNIVLNFVLMQFMAHRGLALATSITACVNYFLLMSLIKKKMPQISFSGILINIAKTLLICIFLYFFLRGGCYLFPVTGRVPLLIRDALLSVFTLVLFYLIGMLIKIDYITQAGKKLCHRFLKK